MKKNSHRALAISLSPLLFIPIPTITNSLFEKINIFQHINKTIQNYNSFFEELLNSIINIPNALIGLDLFITLMLIFKILIFSIGYFYGSTLPDLDRYFKYLYKKSDWNKRYLYHRQTTHGLLFSMILFFVSVNYISDPFIMAALLGITLGIITHQIGDMLTGSIPILFYAPYYIRFSRIGITVFLPKSLHSIFTEKLPNFFNKYYKRIFIPLFAINLLFFISCKFF